MNGDGRSMVEASEAFVLELVRNPSIRGFFRQASDNCHVILSHSYQDKVDHCGNHSTPSETLQMNAAIEAETLSVMAARSPEVSSVAESLRVPHGGNTRIRVRTSREALAFIGEEIVGSSGGNLVFLEYWVDFPKFSG